MEIDRNGHLILVEEKMDSNKTVTNGIVKIDPTENFEYLRKHSKEEIKGISITSEGDIFSM